MMETGQEEDLPPAVALLWRARRTPRRGPRPALSLDRITEAAIEIADEEGLATVSMARIAERLGFTTMSLYRYVSGKEDILALMSDAGTEVPAGSFRRPEDKGWREGLERWCLAQYDLMMRRRWIADLAFYTLPVGPNRMAWIDRGLECLEGTPLSPADRFAVIGLLSQHALGEVRLQSEVERLAWSGFEALLHRLADPVAHPSIHRALGEGQIEPAGDATPEDDGRVDALFRLRTVLDGVEALIARERRARRR
jgi:AcrR family transcriptional regulator